MVRKSERKTRNTKRETRNTAKHEALSAKLKARSSYKSELQSTNLTFTESLPKAINYGTHVSTGFPINY